MRKRLLVTVLVVLALALACQADSPTPSPTPSDDLPEDSLAYLRLLERYLVPMWGDPVTVYPQALPDGFGMEIPLPQEGELARSVVRRIGSSREDILVYIDASTGPEEAVAFYAERFAEAGWGEPEVDWDAGGFVETDTPFIKMFCPGDSQETPEEASGGFTLTARFPEEMDTTHVVINLPGWRLFSDCRSALEQSRDDWDRKFPRLEAPAGASVEQGGSGRSGNSQHVQARVETGLSLAEVESHYRQQLLEEGWDLLRVGEDAGRAWSAWLTPDEGLLGEIWVGLLEVRYSGGVFPDDGDTDEETALFVSLQIVTSEDER